MEVVRSVTFFAVREGARETVPKGMKIREVTKGDKSHGVSCLHGEFHPYVLCLVRGGERTKGMGE